MNEVIDAFEARRILQEKKAIIELEKAEQAKRENELFEAWKEKYSQNSLNREMNRIFLSVNETIGANANQFKYILKGLDRQALYLKDLVCEKLKKYGYDVLCEEYNGFDRETGFNLTGHNLTITF